MKIGPSLPLLVFLVGTACGAPSSSPPSGAPAPPPPPEITSPATPSAPSSTPSVPAAPVGATPAPGGAPAAVSAAPTAPDPAAPPRTGIRIPPRVAAFALAGRRNFEVPGAGSLFRYTGPDSLYADVYLYPGPDLGSSCDISCADRVMTEEATRFATDEMPVGVRDGVIRSFEVISHDTLTAPPDAAWKIGRHVRLTLEYPDRPGTHRSDYYLYYLPSVRLKVRVTYVETAVRTASVDEFLRELVPALVPSSGAW